MKIKRFTGRKVNGYLNFDIGFFDELTFITGINGTGKTSALNSIAALLLPRFDYLAREYFEKISLEISHQNVEVSLSAMKSGTKTELSCSLFPDEKFPVVEFDPPDTIPPHRVQEYEDEHYRNIFAQNVEHPVLNFIDGLPTLMYLGLDRRSLSIGNNRFRSGHRPIPRMRKRKNIFSRSLEEGLSEALILSRERFRKDRRREDFLDEKFRENLVLALIDFPPISFSGKLEKPSKEELSKIEEARTNLQRLPYLLNVGEEIISTKVNPMFKFLDEQLLRINRKTASKDEVINALIDWSYNKTQVTKINQLSEIVSKYNDGVKTIKKHTSDYLSTVNSFMRDSGKTMTFNSIGELRFILESEDEGRHISTLSSGEIQLVVILTYLYFNPEVETANVFMIDEPELSLHVRWQEKFVDGISAASKETQFILATHSPSIILDKTNKCKELTIVEK